MAFQLLKLNTIENYDKKLIPNGNLLQVYEHRTNTAGVIYVKELLEDYVRKNQKDPIEDEFSGIQGIQGFIERNINNSTIYEEKIPDDINEIIKINYRLFKIYLKSVGNINTNLN